MAIMGRLISVIDRGTASTAVEVPEDVAAELVELADHLAKNPNQAAHATFDTPAETEQFEKQARYWAVTNQLIFRRVRSKDLPKTQLKFTLKTAEESAEDTAADTAADTDTAAE